MEEGPTSYGVDNLKRAGKIFSLAAEQGQRAVCGLLYASQSARLSFRTRVRPVKLRTQCSETREAVSF